MKDRLHLEHYQHRIEVKSQINNCERCPLGQSPHRVPFTGNTWSPDLIIMGEAPGANEALAHEPFVGKAGKLLDAMLEEAGTSRKRVAMVNTVCCRPPSNRDPEPNEIYQCAGNRQAQTNLAKTSFGVTVGRVPLSVLRNDSGVLIGKQINQGFWADEVFWIPTYHPAYALRNSGAGSVIVSSIKYALKYVSGQMEAPDDPSWPNYKMVDGLLVKKNEMSKVPVQLVEQWPVFLHREWIMFRHDSEMLAAARELRQQGLA